jgi:hypothetical protein
MSPLMTPVTTLNTKMIKVTPQIMMNAETLKESSSLSKLLNQLPENTNMFTADIKT